MGAVGVFFQESKRESGAAVAIIAVFIPDTTRANEIIPEGVAGDDFATLGRNEVTAVLHEFDVDVGQVQTLGIGIVIVGIIYFGEAAIGGFTIEFKPSREGVAGRCRVGRKGKCGFIDGRTGIGSVEHFIGGEEGTADAAVSG